MKRILSLLLLGGALLSFESQAQSQAPERRATCSVKSLEGTYGYVINGLKRQGEFFFPYLEIGQEVYDGNGNVSNILTTSNTRRTSTIFGRYEIGADCRGAIAYYNGDKVNIYVEPSGDNLSFLQVGEPGSIDALGGKEHRLTRTKRATCTSADLRGTYSYSARGIKGGQVYLETGFETYDGRGRVRNVYTDNASQSTSYVTGVYSVAANCSASVRYDNGDTYTLHVAPGGDEFSWLQIRGLAQYEFFGGIEHRMSRTIDNSLVTAPAAPAKAKSTAVARSTASPAPASFSAASTADATTTPPLPPNLLTGNFALVTPNVDSSYTGLGVPNCVPPPGQICSMASSLDPATNNQFP